MQIREDFAYEIHSPIALLVAGLAPISRDRLHCYVEPVTYIAGKKEVDYFFFFLEERKHS